MNTDRMTCPYCGESIALIAKKCRFCGEWLSESSSLTAPQVSIQKNQNLDPVQSELAYLNGEEYIPAVQAPTMPGQPYQPQIVPQQQAEATTFNTPEAISPQQINNNQQIVFQPNIVIENTSIQTVENEETEIIVEDESSSNWLYFECLLVGVGVWIGSGHFWWGLITAVLLMVACRIPYIGHVLCVALGAAMGLVVGVICKAFGAELWISWVLGIFVGLGSIYANLMGRKIP